ncbi:MAG: glycosyltransferase family A protein [Patescibacteria group bacterium]|nr:glycosyltransferase family A protein [Patescibacteria group bacterium]MDD5490488.1 glycosyltransferase family A protein [Patescibacteria group bacterium]
MSTPPKISILIPAYQAGKTISRCLESIFSQTFQDFEVIVVNDGSIDDTLQKLEKYQTRIKIINQQNGGAPKARNRGFQESRGRYILFCDADIILKPDALQKMIGVLEANPEISYVYSSFYFGWKKFKLHEFDGEKLKQYPYIHTTALIRREHFPEFDESLKKFQDWDLWLTMLERGYVGKWIPEFLFRAQAGGTMSNWLPSFIYKIPWNKIGWKPKVVKKYEAAREIIKKKHGL